jgi:hypothetical protein
MATGTEMMVQAAVKMILSHLKLDPEMVKDKVAGITQIMSNHEAQQNQIIADLAAIKRHLGIEETEHDDGHEPTGISDERRQIAVGHAG